MMKMVMIMMEMVMIITMIMMIMKMVMIMMVMMIMMKVMMIMMIMLLLSNGHATAVKITMIMVKLTIQGTSQAPSLSTRGSRHGQVSWLRWLEQIGQNRKFIKIEN